MRRTRGEPTDEEDARIGALLRQRRMELKLAMQDVGERVGVTHQAIQKMEKGRARVSPQRAVQFAQALDLQPSQFIHPSYKAAFQWPMSPREAEQVVAAVQAFIRIRNPARRKIVLDLAKALAEEEESSA